MADIRQKPEFLLGGSQTKPGSANLGQQLKAYEVFSAQQKEQEEARDQRTETAQKATEAQDLQGELSQQKLQREQLLRGAGGTPISPYAPINLGARYSTQEEDEEPEAEVIPQEDTKDAGKAISRVIIEAPIYFIMLIIKLLHFIPFIGQILVPVLTALVNGMMKISQLVYAPKAPIGPRIAGLISPTIGLIAEQMTKKRKL